MRPIDADELKRRGCESCGMMSEQECKDYMGDCCFLNEVADNMPTLDVAPVVHAEFHCVNDDKNVYMCTNCGGEWCLETGTPEENDMEWCSFCGARMDGEKNA